VLGSGLDPRLATGLEPRLKTVSVQTRDTGKGGESSPKVDSNGTTIFRPISFFLVVHGEKDVH
jgi:hypothetical protein